MAHTIWAYRQGAFRPGNGRSSVVSLPLTNNLGYLVPELARMGAHGEVSRLAIVAHGDDAGPQGSSFLRALSTFWPGRTVIGFITSGEFNPHYFTAGDVFDTGGPFVGGSVLSHLPRAEMLRRRMTPASPSAKWAKNGQIARLPLAETPL